METSRTTKSVLPAPFCRSPRLAACRIATKEGRIVMVKVPDCISKRRRASTGAQVPFNGKTVMEAQAIIADTAGAVGNAATGIVTQEVISENGHPAMAQTLGVEAKPRTRIVITGAYKGRWLASRARKAEQEAKEAHESYILAKLKAREAHERYVLAMQEAEDYERTIFVKQELQGTSRGNVFVKREVDECILNRA